MSELDRQGRRSLYQRDSNREIPIVNNREIRYVPQCLLCNLVKNLIEKGHIQDEAIQAEEDMYRMIYLMWDAQDIAAWLEDAHNYKVSHDSVSRHIRKHIPDPTVAFYERIRSYGANHEQHRFVKNMAETMRMTASQFRQDVISGNVEIKPTDFVKIFQTLREWDELNEKTEEKVIRAVVTVVDEVIQDEELRAHFDMRLRQELEAMDSEEGY